MRTFASASCNIAWFQLADFVARGQKERALYMYRLLMHSIDDRALSFQLEGDILASFLDDSAIDKYLMAIEMYKKSGKFQQAIGLCLQASIFQDNVHIASALFHLYCIVKNKPKAEMVFSHFAKLCLKNNDFDFLQQTVAQFLLVEGEDIRFTIVSRCAIELLLHGAPIMYVDWYIDTTVQLFDESVSVKGSSLDQGALQKFLSELSVLDTSIYDQVQKQIGYKI